MKALFRNDFANLKAGLGIGDPFVPDGYDSGRPVPFELASKVSKL